MAVDCWRLSSVVDSSFSLSDGGSSVVSFSEEPSLDPPSCLGVTVGAITGLMAVAEGLVGAGVGATVTAGVTTAGAGAETTTFSGTGATATVGCGA